jgi:hypothetical protein
LRDGRLFQFEVRPQASAPAEGKTPRRVSHFWLCGECASRFTLVFDQLKALVLKSNLVA